MKNTVLVTGANGEIGHGLIPELAKTDNYEVYALDINDLDESLIPYIKQYKKGSVLDKDLLFEIINKNKINLIFHLAAILSTGGEKDPEKTQLINVQGTSNLLEIANSIAKKNKRTIKFIFPSTIAVYGLPDIKTKMKTQKIAEDQYLSPLTIYGITKLYCEKLGKYYSSNYKMFEKTNDTILYIDFRCIRFPGIISAVTIPTGGTSDYAPEMIHSAAKGINYNCFVRPDTKISFMVMPDAVNALIKLSKAPKEKLNQFIYNVEGFSLSAKEIEKLVINAFPNFEVDYNPDKTRQKIVDSWPASVNDNSARKDWGWKPDFNIEKAFKDYLIPEIKKRYKD